MTLCHGRSARLVFLIGPILMAARQFPTGNDVAVQHRCYNNYLQLHGPSVLET